MNQLADKSDKLAQTNASLLRFEHVRARLADTYKDETGEQWVPRPTTVLTQTRTVTSAGVEAARLVDDLRHSHDLARSIKGTPIAVTAWKGDAAEETVFKVLDQVRAKHPNMCILHGDAPGPQKTAARWARQHDVAQVVFLPDRRAHGNAAIARRDKAILDAAPLGVVDFSPGKHSTLLADMARKRGIPVLSVAKGTGNSVDEPGQAQRVSPTAAAQELSRNKTQKQRHSISL